MFTAAMDLHHVLPQVRITDLSLSQESLSNSNVSVANTPKRLSISDSETSCSPKTFLSPSPTPYSEQWWSGKFDFAAKIIILGDYGVGKTTLLSTLGGLKDMGWCRCVSFRPNEFVEMECVKNEKKVLIRIMDTGGECGYGRGGGGVCVCVVCHGVCVCVTACVCVCVVCHGVCVYVCVRVWCVCVV